MKPHVLAGGLAAAREAAPHLHALAGHMLPFVPGRPLASHNIRAITALPHADPFALPVAAARGPVRPSRRRHAALDGLRRGALAQRAADRH